MPLKILGQSCTAILKNRLDCSLAEFAVHYRTRSLPPPSSALGPSGAEIPKTAENIKRLYPMMLDKRIEQKTGEHLTSCFLESHGFPAMVQLNPSGGRSRKHSLSQRGIDVSRSLWVAKADSR
jgi:hypothetical protein